MNRNLYVTSPYSHARAPKQKVGDEFERYILPKTKQAKKSSTAKMNSAASAPTFKKSQGNGYTSFKA